MVPDFPSLLHPPPVVTVVRLNGLIAAGGGMLRGGLNLAGQEGILKAAFAPRRLAAVALAVNSPGGSPVQSALLGARIRAHAEERHVPVLAFVEDVAASGGYWLAAAADEIFADASSIVGSIGVVSAGFGVHEAIARLGIERRLHTQGERKRMLDPFLPEKPEDVARLMALQADIHDAFKAWVRQRRGARLTADEATLFTGEVWTGRRAVALGLIDGLGDLRSVLRARFGEKVRLKPVGGRRGGWLRRRLGLDAGPADWLAAVEERLTWGRWGL
ncbi:MAG: S49 family peptidase [Magnetospirillum sp.]|nr:S49 family peptidase [Magnetospirillum sp.]